MINKAFLVQIALCVFLALGSSFSTFAQKDWTIEWGKTLELNKKEGTIDKIINSNNSGFFALRSTGGGRAMMPAFAISLGGKKQSAWIDHYDNKFKLLKSMPLELTYKKEDLTLEDVISLKNKMYVLSSFFNKKQEKNYLFAQSVDPATMKISPDYTKLTEFDMANKYRGASYDISYSSDSSRILIHAALVFQKGQQEKHTLSVWDSDMNKQWEKTVTLPYPENDIVVKSFRVDNGGNAYIVAARDRSRKEKKERKEYDTDYYVFAWSDGGATFKEYKAALEQKYISGFNLLALDNGDLACAGLYSESEEGQVKGAFFYRINPADGSISHKNFKAFEFEVRAEGLSERKQKKAKEKESKKEAEETELVSYKLDGMFKRNDDHIILVAEQTYTTTSQSYDGKNWHSYSVYHSDDLVVANITPEGQMMWSSLVSKKQTNFDGYVCAVIGDKLNFIYKNTTNGASIQLAALTNDGKVDYNFVTANDELNLDSRACGLMDARTLIIHTRTRKEHKFGKIIFQ